MSDADFSPAPVRWSKPGYRTSRRYLWLSFAGAWGVIVALVAGALAGEPQAVAIAPSVVPSMVLLICGVLGVHRFAGAMDMRSAVEIAAAPVAVEPRGPRPPIREEGDA